MFIVFHNVKRIRAKTSLGCLLTALLCGVGHAQPSPIDAESMTKEQEATLLKHLRAHKQPAIEFVVGQFKHHDAVLLGETHQVAENCQFVASLIKPLYAAGVHTLAWEFTRSCSNKELQTLVTDSEFDDQLAIRLFREHPWPTWGYQEYVAVLRAAWTLNSKLRKNNSPFHIIGIESDNWSQHELFFGKQTQLQYFQQMMAREKHMAEVVREASLNMKRKALVYMGQAHTSTKQGFRVGKMLRDEYGPRIKQVVLHHSWPTRQGRHAPITQALERVSIQAGGGRSIGFDIVKSPFDRLVDPQVVYWKAIPNARLSSFAESYVFLKPLKRLHDVTWIPSFVDEKNFAKARDIAVKMKWIEKDAAKNAKQLNEALRQKFSGELSAKRP